MRATAGWLTQTAMLLLLLGVVAAAVRFAESKLAFFPLPGETRTPDAFGIAFTPTTLETADGERIRVWQLPRADARARVVYFHGNGGNLSLWSDVLAGLWQQGFEVVAVDYRGYGVSTGQPSESGLYRDVDATLAFVHEQLPRSDAPTDLLGPLPGHADGRLRGEPQGAGWRRPRIGISDDAIGARDQPDHVGAVVALELPLPHRRLDGGGDVTGPRPPRRPRQCDSLSARASGSSSGCPVPSAS